MKIGRKLVSFLLCAIFLFSSLLLLGSHFIRNQLFGSSFYRDVIASPAYLPLVRREISTELERQGRFVDIPPAVLEAGIDESLLYMRMQDHISNLVDFLNFRTSLARIEYPRDMFLEPILVYVEDMADELNLQIDQEQVELLEEVAADSARITMTHINLFDLDQISESTAFRRLHRLLYDLGDRLRLSALTLIVSLTGLILLHMRSWRTWLKQVLVCIWLVGSTLLVPSAVLSTFNLHRRLALETPYLQYAVSRLLEKVIWFFIAWGIVVFTVSTISLAAMYITDPVKKRKKLKIS